MAGTFTVAAGVPKPFTVGLQTKCWNRNARPNDGPILLPAAYCQQTVPVALIFVVLPETVYYTVLAE